VVEQQDADGLSSHSGYQSPLHRFFDYQPNGPAGATLRRVTADHGDNPLFLAIVQHFSRSGPRLLVEGAFEAAFLVTVRHIANCLRSQGNHGGDSRSADALGQLGKRQGAKDNAHLLHSATQQFS
jgi:hypothetical protein